MPLSTVEVQNPLPRGFAPLARATITCDGYGVTTSRYDELTYDQLRRPIYPLDSFPDP